jgi:hypothetical protein
MERFLVEESENEGVGWRESQGGRAIGSLPFPFCHDKKFGNKACRTGLKH